MNDKSAKMKRTLDDYVTEAKRTKLDIVSKLLSFWMIFFKKNGYEEIVKRKYEEKLNEHFEVIFLGKKPASTKLVEKDWMNELASIKADIECKH